jgi:hypothetical protein
MKNADRIPTTESAIARVAPFMVTPPVRCFTQVGAEAHQKCGELATGRRRGNRWFGDTFHCSQHSEATDTPIAGDFVVRRVRVTCDVLLAGTDERQGLAQAEAVARLGALVAAAGGVLDIKLTTSQTGRYPAVTDAGAPPTTSGSLE